MKISDSIETTSGLHVFETPEDLIINSQVYDKFSMDPKPYSFFNIQTLANKSLLFNEVNILEYSLCNPSKEPDYKYFIQDNQDSSVFYCLLEIGAADPNQYLHKIQKVNNNYKLIKSMSPDSGYRAGADSYTTFYHYKLLGQTKDYIIITQKCGYGENTRRGSYGDASWDFPAKSANGIIAINKKDLSTKSVQITTVYDNHIQLIKEFNDYMYIYENINGKQVRILKYSPSNNNLTEVFSEVYVSRDTCKSPISNIVLFNNSYYILFTSGAHDIGAAFIKMDINFDTDTVSRTYFDITDVGELANINGTLRADYLQNNFLRYTLSNVNDQYIQITVHNATNADGKYYHVYSHYYFYYATDYGVAYGYAVDIGDSYWTNGYHRHYLYKYKNNKFQYITKITPNNDQQCIYGLLYLDEYTPVFHLQTGVEIYKLDLETETYTKVFEAPGTFQTIGLDENNNFYIFDVNNKCQIYNLNSCSALNGRFEHDAYNYDGEDIETNVTIASKNFIGELIASKIHVELSGNCKFRNGKQEATLNTRLDLEYEVPVIITGSGVVYCNINEVE